jgi:hypothetical protein
MKNVDLQSKLKRAILKTIAKFIRKHDIGKNWEERKEVTKTILKVAKIMNDVSNLTELRIKHIRRQKENGQ